MSLDTPVSETTRGTPFVICHQVPARVAFGVVAGAAIGTAFATVLWFFFLNKFAHPDCRCVEPS